MKPFITKVLIDTSVQCLFLPKTFSYELSHAFCPLLCSVYSTPYCMLGGELYLDQ